MVIIRLVVIFCLLELKEDLADEVFGAAFVAESVIFLLTTALLVVKMPAPNQLRHKYHAERDRNQRLGSGLRAFIEARFSTWTLGQSAEDIAWPPLHGYSFQEIAEVRNTKGTTLRRQASSRFTNSASGNRAEFVALFLEELPATSHSLPMVGPPPSNDGAVSARGRDL